MKLAVNTWASALLLSLPAAAENALVFLSGHQATNSPSATLTTSETRLVLAQRLGLSQYHSLAGASDRTIQAVNDFGIRQSLFANDDERQRARGLVVIEGVSSHLGSALSKLSAPAFFLAEPPTSDTNADFFGDLQAQHYCIHGSRRDWTSAGSLDSMLNDVHTGSHGADYLHHSRELQFVAENHGVSSAEYKTALTRIVTSLARALSATSSNELTVILMPEAPSAKTHSKRTSNSSWGSYTKAKRQTDTGSVAGDSDFVPGPPSDDFDLVDSPTTRPPPPAPVHAAPLANAGAADGISISQSNDTVIPPRGILPACYSSRDDCESVTNGCSGHGICQLKYAIQSGKNKGSCFACACEAERVELREGVYKTTVWGGPACQKKDVSVPLWLLGGTVVSLLFAVIWGVSMLYSMGSEELPSVIGAGVAGVGARGK